MERLSFLDQELQSLKEQGLYRLPRTLSGEQKAVSIYDGKSVVNLSSNNYLGLANHPRLVEAALKATRKYGVGSGAVRTIAGQMDLHREFEEKLADFKKVEACLLFQSGFTANSGTVSCILGREDVIISDELNHASIIDGSRLSRAEIKVYPHADLDGLRARLEETGGRQKLIVTDGVFSMDGDIAPLPEIVSLAREFEALVMIDDAHASGVLGQNGRGTVDHYNLHGEVDIQVGTLSKAIGVLGGYVAGPQKLIDYLIQRARPVLFSTSAPPAVAAAALAALEILLEKPELIDRLWENTEFFRSGLQRQGFNTGASATPIIPVIVGDERQAMRLADGLFEQGVFAQGIAFPTVQKGKARVRTIVSAAHSRKDLEYALDTFVQVGRSLGII
ncbi:MAG: glycine C-acetyltransferase [Firmicutes bacterium]|nr:glycine C-acetyltransferase [Bacillota bacterium]